MINGGCQLGIKVVTHNSKSDLSLNSLKQISIVLKSKIYLHESDPIYCTKITLCNCIFHHFYMLFKGFMKHGEHFDPYRVASIMVFSFFQLIYMTVCLIGTRFMFNYEFINALYLIMITVMAVWNGGSYYIQIFSQRYNAKFIPKKSNNNVPSSNCSSDKSD